MTEVQFCRRPLQWLPSRYFFPAVDERRKVAVFLHRDVPRMVAAVHREVEKQHAEAHRFWEELKEVLCCCQPSSAEAQEILI